MARWQRMIARVVLVTFTSSFVACGGTGSDTSTTSTAAAPSTTTTPATVPPPPTLPQPPEQLGKEELRDLVAPVALYPDVVLASLLPATTHGDEIHYAALYAGDAARVEHVPEDRGWDGSVLGLLQFPDVLRWLDDNPAWTDQMAQAMTYQQADVLDAIQDYRRMVRDAGNLKSNQYQTVRSSDQDVRIEPARPDVVYVPTYDPAVATQPQPESPGINPWIIFGGGAIVGALGAWALYSIFDDDDEEHVHYHGGGRRRVRAYDNYYYSRGRRPRRVDWTPPPRNRRARNEGWRKTKPLHQTAQAEGTKASGPVLRPPTKQDNTEERLREKRRERRDERREERQEKREQRRMERQQPPEERRQRQLERRQQRQEQKQQRRMERQKQPQPEQPNPHREQRDERQEMRQDRRMDRQEQKQDQKQEQREHQQEQRQERQQDRLEQRQQNQEQRQQRQEERREQRQNHQEQQRQQRQEKRKQKNQQEQPAAQ